MNVNQIAEGFLWCRDVLHAWSPHNAVISRNAQTRRREVAQVLICDRCGTLKTRVLATNGELLRNSYSYPSGYLQKDQGPMTPADRGWIRSRNLERNFTIEDGA